MENLISETEKFVVQLLNDKLDNKFVYHNLAHTQRVVEKVDELSELSQLNDIEKALVFLYLEDKNYKEISETLGISEVNARVKMNRVKTKLRTILNP